MMRKRKRYTGVFLSAMIVCFLLFSLTTVQKSDAKESVTVYKCSQNLLNGNDYVVLACEYESEYYALSVNETGGISAKRITVVDGIAENISDDCVFIVEKVPGETVLLKSKSNSLYLAKPTALGLTTTSDPTNAAFSPSEPYNWTGSNGNSSIYYFYDGEKISVTAREEDAGTVKAFIGEEKTVVNKTISLYGKDGKVFKQISSNTPLPDYDWGENGVFLGWSDGKNLFDVGSFINDDNDDYFAVGVVFYADYGASVRVCESSDESGIRFSLNFDFEEFKSAESFISEYGGIISPTDLFKDVCEFDLDNLIEGQSVVKINATKNYVEDDKLKFNVALIKIHTSNYDRDFSVRGYVKVKYFDGEKFVYTNYSEEDNSRSIRTVASRVKADGYKNLSEKQKEIIDGYIGEGGEL